MKKRPLTLIEVMVALGIASLLLGVLFPYLKKTLAIKKELEMAKVRIFSKAHLQERVGSLLSKISSPESFQTVEEKEKPLKLKFEFDNGYDFEKPFSGTVTGSFFVENQKLIFETQGEEKKTRQEVLFEHVKGIVFEFSHAEKGTFEVCRKWNPPHLPLFFAMHITTVLDEQESFYFRLHGEHHLRLP
jgi:type II secretory pathway pseudopilin PulG